MKSEQTKEKSQRNIGKEKTIKESRSGIKKWINGNVSVWERDDVELHTIMLCYVNY